MVKDETMDISYEYDVTTTKYTKGANSNKFIMLHHTASVSSLEDMTNYLSKNSAEVSVHYIIDQEGKYSRIGMDNYILWHAGNGDKIKGYENVMNSHAIGIEVISDWTTFTKRQIESLWHLVKELQKKHNIRSEEVIRHKDYTDRKIDIWDAFYKLMGYKTYQEWKDVVLDGKNTDSEAYSLEELTRKMKRLEKMLNKTL